MKTIRVNSTSKQKGVLMLVTLLILLIVSWLGMATMDTTGLEMQMSSNSRDQQQAFEAAEYTLSWVENNMANTGYFSTSSLTNSDCGLICFEDTCTGGYCFDGANPDDWGTCTLTVGTSEPYESAAMWAGSGFHQTLAIPNTTMTAKYIVEFLCYTSRDEEFAMDVGNNTKMYRITAYTVGEGGRARSMLRSLIKET